MKLNEPINFFPVNFVIIFSTLVIERWLTTCRVWMWSPERWFNGFKLCGTRGETWEYCKSETKLENIAKGKPKYAQQTKKNYRTLGKTRWKPNNTQQQEIKSTWIPIWQWKSPNPKLTFLGGLSQCNVWVSLSYINQWSRCSDCCGDAMWKGSYNKLVHPEPRLRQHVAPSHGPDSDVSQLSPGNWEAIVSRQNAASSAHPCVCSVWDSEDLSKLGKSWKWELFWSRLREKGAPAPRFPFTFLTSQWEASISSAHLCL